MSGGQVRIRELDKASNPEVKEIKPPDKTAGFRIDIITLSKQE